MASAALAQTGTPLSLTDAIARARARHPDAAAALVAEQAAAQAVTAARAGYMPTVDLVESWQRSNQPVFVFSSLLSQRRFTAANFAIDTLNHPDAVNNFRTGVVVDQPIYNGAVGAATTSASVAVQLATAQRQLIAQQLATAVTDAYGRVVVADGARTAAAAAVRAANADRELVINRRNAGLATDADALQMELLAARAEQQRINADAEARIARARLAALIDAPLDEEFSLSITSPAASPVSDLPALQQQAVQQRPDVLAARLQVELAGARIREAKASFLPQVGVQAGWEGNGEVWTSRAGSWVVGASARINLFRGRADSARLAAANDVLAVRRYELVKAETDARVDVIAATARLDAARGAAQVARAAVTQARESHRIIRDRYEAGLVDVAMLLRAADAEAQAETQLSAADAAVLTTSAQLDQALGRL